MALPAFISAAVTAGQTVQAGVGLLTGGGKDPERYAANKAAYDAALAGDDNAILFLKQRTGEYGVTFVPGYGSVGGWAGAPTSGPAQDAKVKYTAALAAKRGETAIQTGASKLGERVQESIDQAASKAGASAGQQVAIALFAAALLILVVFMVVRRRGRRRA